MGGEKPVTFTWVVMCKGGEKPVTCTNSPPAGREGDFPPPGPTPWAALPPCFVPEIAPMHLGAWFIPNREDVICRREGGYKCCNHNSMWEGGEATIV